MDQPTMTWMIVGPMPMRNTGLTSSYAKKTRWLMRTMPVDATPGISDARTRA